MVFFHQWHKVLVTVWRFKGPILFDDREKKKKAIKSPIAGFYVYGFTITTIRSIQLHKCQELWQLNIIGEVKPNVIY